jgi:hypothetical protein
MEQILINVLKYLTSIISMCTLYVILSRLQQIFYITDKWNSQSIQFKMSLRGPKPTRNVDGLSLIFIEFYVPVLTLRINNTETSLQLSGNITLFAVCRIYYTCVINKET